MRISLVAAAATIAALAAPTTASAELVTDGDNLQAALDEFPPAPTSRPTARRRDLHRGREPRDDRGQPVLRQRRRLPRGAVALILDNQVFAPVARGDASAVTLRGNTFGDVEDGHDAEGDGGAVYISSFFRDVVVDDNTFTENDSENRGGGLRIDPTQFVSLTGNTFEANEAGNDGGGAAVDTCEAEISSNVFEGNEAVAEDFSLEGGGLYLDGFCSQNNTAGRSVVVTAVTQSGNAFANNRIGGEFTQGEGVGEFIRNLGTSSTNDGFVGNVTDATSGGRGGGLAFEAGGQSFTARNLVATGNESRRPTSRRRRPAGRRWRTPTAAGSSWTAPAL